MKLLVSLTIIGDLEKISWEKNVVVQYILGTRILIWK